MKITRRVSGTAMFVLAVCLIPQCARGQGGSGSVHVFYFDSSNGHLAQLYISNNSWNYQDVSTKANVYPSGLLSGYNDATGEHVFFVDSSGSVGTAYWNSGNMSWAGRDPLTSSQTTMVDTTSNLATFFESRTGFDNVYYVGTDHHIYHLAGASGTWTVNDVTAQTGNITVMPGSQIAAFADTGSACCQRVFFEGQENNHIYFLLFNGSSWQGAVDLTSLYGNGVSAEYQSPMFGYVDSAAEHIYYIGTNGTNLDVQHLYWSSGSWHQIVDVTGLVSDCIGCSADPSTSLAAFTDSVGTHVFFMSPGHQAYGDDALEFLFQSNRWFVYDTSINNGGNNGAPANGRPMSAVVVQSGTKEYVFYLDTLNNHLYRNLSTNGQTWTTLDVTGVGPFSPPIPGAGGLVVFVD